MPKRAPLKITGPLALRVHWVERLLPERHLSGTTAEERARLAYTLGLLIFSVVMSALFLVLGLAGSRPYAHVDAVGFASIGCYSLDLILLWRFGFSRRLVLLVVAQLGGLLLTGIALGGQLAFSMLLLAPPMLLMFLVSLRAAHVGTVISVLAVLVLGAMKELELLKAAEPTGLLVGPGIQALAINTWLLAILPLMLVFDGRRSWMAGEAHLLTRILLNARQQTRELLSRFHEQIAMLLQEAELPEEVAEGLQEAEASAQRLSEVMDQLARIAKEEPAAARALRHRLESIGDDIPERIATSERQIRFMLRVSLLFLVICCGLLPMLLLTKGPAYPMSWVVIAAMVSFIPNVLLLRRRSGLRPTITWIAVQVVVLCVFGVLVTGDLHTAIWVCLVPVVLLYVVGVRWALGSTLLLTALVSVLAASLRAGYSLPPAPPITGSIHLDHAGFCGLFITTSILLFAYFERDRMRSASVLTLRSSALSRLSHELRTPLNGILGTLSWVREDLPSEGVLSGHLSLAEGFGQQLSSLVDDALSLAVLSGGRVERKIAAFRLQELEARLQQEAERLAEMHFIDIDVSYEASGPERLCGEHDRLETMLVGLLRWASEHRPGQSIMLRLSVQQQARSRWWLEVALLDNDRSVNDDRVSGLADQFVHDHQGRDRNALRVALCRAQVDYLGGHLQAFEKISRGILLSLPLKENRH